MSEIFYVYIVGFLLFVLTQIILSQKGTRTNYSQLITKNKITVNLRIKKNNRENLKCKCFSCKLNSGVGIKMPTDLYSLEPL